jgi:Rrf2 family protein
MRLSRTTVYALHATLRLADSDVDRPIPCSTLARHGPMPERFLLQILRDLVEHGILESTRGVDGGYRLKRPPDRITLLDIVEAVDSPLEPSIPDLPGLPEHVRGQIMTALQLTARATRHTLQQLTIADLR